jgi:hypothetical protein
MSYTRNNTIDAKDLVDIHFSTDPLVKAMSNDFEKIGILNKTSNEIVLKSDLQMQLGAVLKALQNQAGINPLEVERVRTEAIAHCAYLMNNQDQIAGLYLSTCQRGLANRLPPSPAISDYAAQIGWTVPAGITDISRLEASLNSHVDMITSQLDICQSYGKVVTQTKTDVLAVKACIESLIHTPAPVPAPPVVVDVPRLTDILGKLSDTTLSPYERIGMSNRFDINGTNIDLMDRAAISALNPTQQAIITTAIAQKQADLTDLLNEGIQAHSNGDPSVSSLATILGAAAGTPNNPITQLTNVCNSIDTHGARVALTPRPPIDVTKLTATLYSLADTTLSPYERLGIKNEYDFGSGLKVNLMLKSGISSINIVQDAMVQVAIDEQRSKIEVLIRDAIAAHRAADPKVAHLGSVLVPAAGMADPLAQLASIYGQVDNTTNRNNTAKDPVSQADIMMVLDQTAVEKNDPYAVLGVTKPANLSVMQVGQQAILDQQIADESVKLQDTLARAALDPALAGFLPAIRVAQANVAASITKLSAFAGTPARTGHDSRKLYEANLATDIKTIEAIEARLKNESYYSVLAVSPINQSPLSRLFNKDNKADAAYIRSVQANFDSYFQPGSDFAKILDVARNPQLASRIDAIKVELEKAKNCLVNDTERKKYDESLSNKKDNSSARTNSTSASTVPSQTGVGKFLKIAAPLGGIFAFGALSVVLGVEAVASAPFLIAGFAVGQGVVWLSKKLTK